MKALLIVDLQNDFLPGGALAVSGGNQIIPVINSIQSNYDLVVATQDWHPKDHMSFASQHVGKSEFETINIGSKTQILWPDHCVIDSLGAAFSPDLKTGKIEAIFRKGTNRHIDSYSGFYDNSKQKPTGLFGYLHERKIKEVHVCGLAADFCVFYTAMDALYKLFETYIVEDATKCIDERGYAEKLKTYLDLGGKILTRTV